MQARSYAKKGNILGPLEKKRNIFFTRQVTKGFEFEIWLATSLITLWDQSSFSQLYSFDLTTDRNGMGEHVMPSRSLSTITIDLCKLFASICSAYASAAVLFPMHFIFGHKP